MSDENKEKVDDEPQAVVRKRVKVIEEEVVDDGPDEEPEEEPGQGKKDYSTEHKAGSKVRVARSVEGLGAPKPSDDKKKPGRRAVTVKKKEEKSEEKDKGQKKSKQGAGKGKQQQEQASEPMPKIEFESKPEPDVTTADFEAMLAGDVDASAPKSADVAAGDRITGTVAAVGRKFVFVEFGSSKREGVAKREDFETEEGDLEVAVGDEVDFYVLSLKGGEIRLGKKLGGREGAMEAIRTAHDTGVPIDGRVVETNKGGYEVAVGGVRAFCPMSQIELAYTEEPEVHVGQTYRFRVTKVAEGGRNVVVSRTALLEEEQAARRKETLESLVEGKIVSGQVTRVVDFGAFIDIGGVEGLAHVSELAHGYFDKPSDVVSPGEKVTVKILKIDKKDPDNLRIGLSIKETQSDPWEEVNKKFSVGQQVEGEVVRLAPFGAFVEIAPGIDGLVHVSEMSWKEHVKHPSDIVEAGEKVRVEIQDIDQIRQRVSLSLKAVDGDPWDTAGERYAPGQEVTGKVENVEDFGAFVRLDSGITALIPRSEMELPSGVTPHRKYSEGAEATARVLNVDVADRKMALTEKAAGDIQVSADSSKPKKSKKSKASGSQSYSDDSGGFGTLGDLLGGELDDE